MTRKQHFRALQIRLEPGQTFTYGKSTYKVKSVLERDGAQWIAAWRFVKTTQKYAGTAYLYRVSTLIEGGAK